MIKSYILYEGDIMKIFFSILVLIIPVLMLCIGFRWRSNPPKDISMIYGYRTTMSMKNKETWDFAHRCFGKACLYINVPLIIVSLILLVLFINSSIDKLGLTVTLIVLIQTAAIILALIHTEVKLKSRFDKSGLPK
ncbi:SdpI family protein [Clostridium sp. C8-1-8]|uniref:SdpI family protein n=1 Tax=Clostridium sp. C8-1-8 TaxID=2698831 RepID=UPI00136C6C4E|nr:SdpI family protein [Clostridium sp. C8-1-8]